MRGGIGPDTIEEVWWRAWTAFAIPHGHDVFAGQWQDFPPSQASYMGTYA